ncbi:MAG: alpha/beta hydrolase domain-containing protein [Acidimicrobiia bacterium]
MTARARCVVLVVLVVLSTTVVAAHAAPRAPSRVVSGAPDVPTATGPITGGDGEIVMRGTTFDLADVGYEATEWFVSGTASSFTSAKPLARSGRWRVTPAESSPYTTRIVVYRPVDASRFSGTTVVEWLNVSAGIDHAVSWILAHTEMIRHGDVWVGVSAQVDGLKGFGATTAGLHATTVEDPARYGSLHIASDSFSYDIYSQVGRLLRVPGAGNVLGGLDTMRLLAIGQSQSAFRLTTYIDAIQPIAEVYDGFLVHSRGSSGAALSESPQRDVAAPEPTMIRHDLDVPVLVFTSESDLFELGAIAARQPDRAGYRDWQVAGTAHFDAYGFTIGRPDTGNGSADAALFAAMRAPSSALTDSFVTCAAPVNTGPHHYVVAAALAALERWVADGTPPPHAPRLRIDRARNDVARDEHGIAIGGIRTPQVDVPVATLSGTGNSGCSLYGTTNAFGAEQIAGAFPSHAAFVDEWNAATERAVTAGFLLRADADHLEAVAGDSSVGS